MFGKEDHSAKLGGDFPDEAGVFGEPFDVTFVAAVEEDGAQSLWAHPVLGVDEVPLFEPRGIREAEMVKTLSEISGFVYDLWLLLLSFRWLRLFWW